MTSREQDNQPTPIVAPDSQSTPNTPATRGEIAAFLKKECGEVAEATKWERKRRLTAAAVRLAPFVSSDLIARDEVMTKLISAAHKAGMPPMEGWLTINPLLPSVAVQEPSAPETGPQSPKLEVIDGGRAEPTPKAKPTPKPEPAPAAKPAPEAAQLIEPVNEDLLENMPVRERIYGHYLTKEGLTILGGAGSAGKSTYAVTLGLSVAIGKPLLGEEVHQQGNVWIYSLEEKKAEVYRHLKATMQQHNIDASAVCGKLFITSGLEEGKTLVIAKETSSGVQHEPVVDLLVADLVSHNIKLLIIDPVIKSHRTSENKNEHADFVATLWVEVATRANCAIVLLHHFRKGGAPGDADSFRGASALVNASRAAVTLSKMTAKEARAHKVSARERDDYVRIDVAKFNLGRKPEPVWLKLNSVTLPNSEEVGAPERWYPPSGSVETAAPATRRILDILSGGPFPGEQYTLNSRSKDRWAGHLLIKELGLVKKQAQRTLAAWSAAGLLVETTYTRPNRNEASGLRVDACKLENSADQ
jgi:hypothetical protein